MFVHALLLIDPIPSFARPSVHKNILLPFLTFFNKDKDVITPSPKAVQHNDLIENNFDKIKLDDFDIGLDIKYEYSSPKLFILFSSFTSLIIFFSSKQSP